ncbi:LacI family DNA-binding transcriptional regulator [Laceyella putida]|uniref:LacI family DNA-binding transcriptional regulator n=1 Tax=Laceyella putida TaxID=110101 RepID=A0ABW2RGZ7_9BACL
MKMTIADIARLAGVSRSTVSKVLNNYPGIGEKNKRKILQIIAETGYQPSYSARRLSSTKSHLIAMIYAGNVSADFNHPFFVDVINAFKKEIGSHGYDLLFFSNQDVSRENDDYLARCQYFQVDGCIIISGDQIESVIGQLDDSEIPCIGVDLFLKGTHSGYIMSDNHQISQLVVEHFHRLGYREIAYIGGTPDSTVAKIRRQGFEHSMKKLGLPVRKEWMLQGDFYVESGYLAMKRLMESGKAPEAVFCASDWMAVGAMQAIKEAGLRIPDDIAIVGCDNINVAPYLDPPLTSINQDKEKLGRLAARMLLDLMDGKMSFTSALVEPALVVRRSCGSQVE